MSNPAIIVITYNRPISLKRLLSSLEKAQYAVAGVELIISIDYQNSDSHNEVVKIADEFDWKHGNKRIIAHEINLGLRKHVISCGNLSQKYGSVILLEDDIFVSPQFYNYSLQMLAGYGQAEYIAGISLYKHEWNVNVNRPFIASASGYDVFLMQFAQSWGQCWTYNMWKNFYDWYAENDQALQPQEDLPKFVTSWPDSSWLKYFITYVVKNKKYFVYPYTSLTTNFSDAGTHIRIKNSKYQVPLQTSAVEYRIPVLENAVKYDVYFERIGLADSLGIREEELCTDLYGNKIRSNKRYWLTMTTQPFKIIRSYGLRMRPHESNIINNTEGEDLFLYDTQQEGRMKRSTKNLAVVNLLYDHKNLTARNVFTLFKYFLLNKFNK